MIMPRRRHDAEALLGQPEQRTITRFWSKVAVGAVDECWPWTEKATQPGGYGCFMLWPGNPQRASRLAWIFRNGRPIPDGQVVRHTCDNPPCCNPAHLILGTQGDNVDDMLRRGRSRYGGKRLSTGEVQAVHELLAGGASLRVAAEQFGVSTASISRVKNGRRPAGVAA